MKSTIFTEILDETTVDVNLRVHTAIDRLRQQRGICNMTDSNNQRLEFKCNKKGKFMVRNYIAPCSRRRHALTEYRIFYVKGEVITQQGDTKIKIYSVRDRSLVFGRYFATAIYILAVIVFLFVFFVLGNPLSIDSIWVLLPLVSCIILCIGVTNVEKNNQVADLNIMKDEAISRAKAIEHWDD